MRQVCRCGREGDLDELAVVYAGEGRWALACPDCGAVASLGWLAPAARAALVDEASRWAFCQLWLAATDRETVRAGGYSLHATAAARRAFLAEHPAAADGPAPHGPAYRCRVDPATSTALRAAGHGLRRQGSPPAPLGDS